MLIISLRRSIFFCAELDLLMSTVDIRLTDVSKPNIMCLKNY
jgi:hypothetical protein